MLPYDVPIALFVGLRALIIALLEVLTIKHVAIS